MDLTMIYAAIVALTVFITWKSRDRGVLSLAILLAMSFALCRLVASVFEPPLRMAIFAVIDVLWMALIIGQTTTDKELTPIRAPMALLYFGSLSLHASWFFIKNPELVVYKIGLNVLFVAELVLVAAWGLRLGHEHYKRDNSPYSPVRWGPYAHKRVKR